MGKSPAVEQQQQDELYYVEKILKHQFIDKKWMYLVKWEGYSSEWNTWEPIDMFEPPFDRVREYHRKRNLPLPDVVLQTEASDSSEPEEEIAPRAKKPKSNSSIDAEPLNDVTDRIVATATRDSNTASSKGQASQEDKSNRDGDHAKEAPKRKNSKSGLSAEIEDAAQRDGGIKTLDQLKSWDGICHVSRVFKEGDVWFAAVQFGDVDRLSLPLSEVREKAKDRLIDYLLSKVSFGKKTNDAAAAAK